MRNALDHIRCLFLAVAVVLAFAGTAQAGLIGKTLAETGIADEQVQNAGDALYNAATSLAIGGKRGAEAGRGISGVLGDLALNSGEITCSLWLIQLRSHFRNLVVTTERARALGEDAAEIARLDDLIAKTQDFALRLEAACTKVGWLTTEPAEEWKTTNRLKSALGLGSATEKASEQPAPTAPPAPPPLPEGWNAADVHCRNVCSGIFEAYANALAMSRNKYAEADRLRKGDLAEATRRHARAQSNLDEVKANPRMDPRNVRRDELALEKTGADVKEAQARADRIAAEGDALARRSQELLEKLKECVKGCRKDLRDMSGLDATRIDAYFTGQVRDGGSAQDAQRYTTLSGDPESRSATAKPSAKLPPKQAAVPVQKPKPVAVDKDGAPAVKDGASAEAAKLAPDKAADIAAACPKCKELADNLAREQESLNDSRAYLESLRQRFTEMMLDSGRRIGSSLSDKEYAQWVESARAYLRDYAYVLEGRERTVEKLRAALADCNKTCVPPPAAKPLVDPVPRPAVATGVAPQAHCPACDARVKAVASKQAELDAANAELDRQRKNFTDATVVQQGEDRRISPDPEVVKQRMDMVGQVKAELRRQGETVRRLEQELEALQRDLDGCNKTCTPPTGEKPGDPPIKVGGGCGWEMPKPVIIGPKAQYGYTDERKAAAVGSAAAGLLGGFLGGRGGGFPGVGAPQSGGGTPRLASDPVRDKQTFTDPKTGTAIRVGSQYRPDGKLLVSVNVDKAEDKGVVHQATVERVQDLPSGGCGRQAIVPVEWMHYEIWEDWWAKIRIQTYKSVDGGPWRQTSDTGWRDWGSGSRLLESGTMSADQIPGTAWGSMGSDRAFGGPRAAGAVFDAGKPLVLDKPAPERLVVQVSQPGKDPVSTVGFALYPTYHTGGKVSYTDKAPDVDAILRGMRPDSGGGMQRIDPPAAAVPAAPAGSILDTLDSGAGKTPLAK